MDWIQSSTLRQIALCRAFAGQELDRILKHAMSHEVARKETPWRDLATDGLRSPKKRCGQTPRRQPCRRRYYAAKSRQMVTGTLNNPRSGAKILPLVPG